MISLPGRPGTCPTFKGGNMRDRNLFEDGYKSLADQLRYGRPRKRLTEFFGSSEAQDAHYLSSVIAWRLRSYEGLEDMYDDELDDLTTRLAHASRVPCEEITERTQVLCCYKKSPSARIEYNLHMAGKCPHFQNLRKRLKEKYGDERD